MKKYLPVFFLSFFFSGELMSQQWSSLYNGSANGMDAIKAMVVDVAGNVYVTGYAFNKLTGNDYVTIKYNTNGVQQWVALYNGNANGSDVPNAIFVDNSGNVYVTGVSMQLNGQFGEAFATTIKYNSNGIKQWVNSYDGSLQRGSMANAVKADANGNVYVTGYTVVKPLGIKKIYLTIKYSSTGVQQWLKTFQGPGQTNNQDDVAIGLALDGFSNVYVTGSVFGNSSGYTGRQDYLTIKYNSSGTQQWTAQYNGPANTADFATGIAADASGNVFVTGYSGGIGLDFATIRYNTNGVQQWVARYNGPANGSDIAYALAIDKSDNVYVTGSDQKTLYNSDYLTIKYNAAGTQQWASRYNGTANDNDESYALAVDKSGNVFVTGYINGTSPSWDIATIKYNASGVQQWVNKYNGPKDSADVGNAIGVDTLGNVYIGGASTGKKTAWDFITVKYQASTAVKTAAVADQKAIVSNTGPNIDNYPNPFNSATTLKFDIPFSTMANGTKVRLVIYDIAGREVKKLVDANMQGGSYEILWDASKEKPGIYVSRFSIGDLTESKKMILIR